MAARVSAAGDDLTAAYRRLNAAYQQTLRYAEDVRRLYQQVQRTIYQSLLGLANALEAKDAYTRGHSERVGAWSRGVAAALGLPPAEVDMIGQAGLLHDIGKIGIPEAVLRKPGGLDAQEWAVMRNHPLIGAQIVAPFDFFTGGALMIRPHPYGQNFLLVTSGSGEPGEWRLTLDDPLQNSDNHTWWFGYHETYDVMASTNLPPITGTIQDYTFRRVEFTVEWARRNV